MRTRQQSTKGWVIFAAFCAVLFCMTVLRACAAKTAPEGCSLERVRPTQAAADTGVRQLVGRRGEELVCQWLRQQQPQGESPGAHAGQACTRLHAWAQDRDLMTAWLLEALGANPDSVDFGHDDHAFDAALSLLPALRGLNGDWTLDLHTLHDPKTGAPVRFAGSTHYWWPTPPSSL